MRTMTRLLDVSAKGASVVVTLMGDKKAGTTDQELGAKLLDIWARDPEHCLVNLEVDQRPDGKLWVTGVEYVEAPEELGGPAEKGADTAAESAAAVAVDSPEKGSAPDLPPADFSLEALLTLADRVTRIEEFLNATHGTDFYSFNS